MICHSKQFFFIHIPKTAGHSIDTEFKRLDLVDVPCWHDTAKEILARLTRPWKYQSFTFVRNPWDRWVSEYFWQLPGSNPHIATEWGNLNVSFNDFCRSDHSWYPKSERHHLADQSSFIYSDSDELLIDYIGRYETLESDWNIVWSMMFKGSIEGPKLPWKNATKHEPYWVYYTPELVEIVGQRFARDIRLLGYEFPMDKLLSKP